MPKPSKRRKTIDTQQRNCRASQTSSPYDAPTEYFTRDIKLRTKLIHSCTVLDVLVLVKLEVSINDSLVFNDFNANKFLSVSCFKRSSYSKTTSDLVEKKTVSATFKHQSGPAETIDLFTILLEEQTRQKLQQMYEKRWKFDAQ